VLKILTFIRHNTIALIALFVALGGTSYAALNLPPNSVGPTQLRNHSITPNKFSTGAIGGYIRYWAWIDGAGKIMASSPHAKILGTWVTNPAPGGNFGGRVTWGMGSPIGPGCTSLATYAERITDSNDGSGGGTPGIGTTIFPAVLGTHRRPVYPAFVVVTAGESGSVNVFVICNQP
jgi:hypothetical protein